MPPGSSPSPTLLCRLGSILEPLDFQALFPRSQPVEIELGSGDGSFLFEYARRNPNTNFIGVERLLGRIRKLDRKAQCAGLDNLRAIRIESSYFLKYLVPEGSISALHVYFPDPWPKRRHWGNRLINESFPLLAARVLGPGGIVYLRTDDPSYFEQMEQVFRAVQGFLLVSTPATLVELWTDFEREFRAQGVETLRAAFQKSAGASAN